MSNFDASYLRSQFPALQQIDKQGQPYIFFDGPAGSQVPQAVIEAISDYYIHANANTHGYFHHSTRTDTIIKNARQAMADFLNAPSPNEIVFGPNATTLAFSLSRSIGNELAPNDEIIVTRLEHDTNVAPWLALQEKGVVIKFVDFDTNTYKLNLKQLQSMLNPKTKLLAVTYASNAIGTINPIKEITSMAHAANVKVWVDAVHYAPHGPIDVQDIDCDYLTCSVYKFFGPHLGVFWGRYDLLERLVAYKVRPADNTPPDKFETGTGNFEGMAGTTAAINYLAHVGEEFGETFANPYLEAGFSERPLALKQGMAAIAAYEQALGKYLIKGLQAIAGIHIYGITDEKDYNQRTPTIAFTKDGLSPDDIAKTLGENNIFVWSGHYYALEVVNHLNLAQHGGMVRVGLLHYNTISEIDRLLNVVDGL